MSIPVRRGKNQNICLPINASFRNFANYRRLAPAFIHDFAAMLYSDIIGQEEIKTRLCRQLTEGRVAHAQLFAGPEGCGKMPMALAFASALLCQNPKEGSACGACQACRMTARLAHPDLHFVFPVFKKKGQSGDATSDQYLPQWRELITESPYIDRTAWLNHIGVENQQSLIGVAEAGSILQKLSIKSGLGAYKVMIVWLPEQMNVAAANKLLKILEEPPQQTVFILVSDAPDMLLQTILSRTQRTDFLPLPAAQIEQALMVRHGLQSEDAKVVAHLSEGNYVKALQQLRVNEDAELFFDMFVLLMRLSYMRKIKDMHEWSEKVSVWGRERQKHFLDYCQRLVRENFVCNFGNPQLVYMNRREADFSQRFARFVNERNVIGIMDEISAAKRDIMQNVNPKMVFFDFSLKMIVLLKQ